MSAPSKIRSTAGFRSIVLFELNTSFLPVGISTLQASQPYSVSGSTISGSAASVIPSGTTVSGSVPYYGIQHSGAKVLTINDPAPRVLTHVGDDGPFSLQILPALEPANGELRVDKTNDPVDAIAGNLKMFTVGEMNLEGVVTNQRGFENQVGALAYSFGQDTDPDSVNFGATVWDMRFFPKVTVFQRDTGYGQEVNEKTYSFTPAFCTAHLWGTAFGNATEGFKRAQIVRGVSQYKPTFVTWKGDGATLGFPLDSNAPAQATTKMSYWKNGVPLVVGATFAVSVRGLSFSVAPLVTDVIECLYEA
jgi:hypothetical protein